MQEFLKIVWQMRLAQKEFFKHRCDRNLRKAIALESQVDKQIKALADGELQQQVATQKEIF